MKTMKRSELSEFLGESKSKLKKDLMFITSFRATKDNSIQVEVCQSRKLGGRTQTLLGLLNKSDKRFRDDTTLLFDWMTLTPQDFINAFPKSGITLEQLQHIANTWTPEAPTGKDAVVYVHFSSVEKIYDVTEEVELTPIIVVTEVTETQLTNGEFFRGQNADERIAASIEDDRNVMKTSSMDDAEYLVHPETGERIFRFTRTEFLENKPVDTIIQGKITESEYKKRLTGASSVKATIKPEMLASILDQGDSI